MQYSTIRNLQRTLAAHEKHFSACDRHLAAHDKHLGYLDKLVLK